MTSKAQRLLGLAAATSFRKSLFTLAASFLIGTRFNNSFRPFSIVRLPGT